MNAHQKILVARMMVVTLTLALAGLDAGGPATGAATVPTLEVRVGGPTLGVSWTGSVSIDRSGTMRLSAEPGLRWEEDRGLLAATRRAMRLLRALVQGPSRLALPRPVGSRN
ncbi:MAG: hypothetical protein PVF68_11305 [Acidobacteriota bacterium]|jgi:hypothetical protein